MTAAAIRSDKKTRSIAIVGGGPAGIATLGALVGKLPKGSSIYQFNSTSDFGPGSAYDVDQLPIFKLNHECDLMGGLGICGVRGVNPNSDFIAWIVRNKEEPVMADYMKYWQENGFPEEMVQLKTYLDTLSEKNLNALDQKIRKSYYLPRGLYGLYMRAANERFKAYATANGISIKPIIDNVVNLTEDKAGCTVTCKKQKELPVFDAAALCIGNWQGETPKEFSVTPHYYGTPYEKGLWKDKLKGALKGKKVVIRGAGLSAVDAAWAAIAIGGAEDVAIVSRHGKLREIRGDTAPYELKLLTLNALEKDAADRQSTFFSLDTLIRLGREELEQHVYPGTSILWDKVLSEAFSPSDMGSYLEACIGEAADGKEVRWRSFLDALGKPAADGVPMREHIYRRLSTEDKKRFVDKHDTTWLSFQAPMPLPTAQEILKFINQGKLRIRKGTLAPKDDKFMISGSEEQFDLMIDTRGQDRDAGKIPLISAMISSGQVKKHPCGGIEVDPATFKIRGRNKIFVIGPLMLGEQFTINSLTNADNANTMAKSILESLHLWPMGTPKKVRGVT